MRDENSETYPLLLIALIVTFSIIVMSYSVWRETPEFKFWSES